MDPELMNSIKELQNKIEDLEEEYGLGIKRKEGFDVLKGIRTQIRILKGELQLLEVSLFDSLS